MIDGKPVIVVCERIARKGLCCRGLEPQGLLISSDGIIRDNSVINNNNPQPILSVRTLAGVYGVPINGHCEEGTSVCITTNIYPIIAIGNAVVTNSPASSIVRA